MRAPKARTALALACVPLIVHIFALNNYGFFRDELYFIICGRHPALGYVDQPPLIPLIAAFTQSSGENLWLLRIVPALMQSGAVFAACAIVRLQGGGRAAEVLAGIAVGLAPEILGIDATLNTTSIEPLTFTLVVYAMLRAIVRDQPRWWIVAGVVAGVSLEAKYTIAFWALALVISLAACGPRAPFARRDFWLGVLACVAIAAPSVIWQAAHGFPFLELLRNGAHGKNVDLGPAAYLVQQILIYTPFAAPLWASGIVALVWQTRTRFIGIAAVLMYALFIALHAKDYYQVGIYPVLFTAGAVAIERLARRIAFAYAGLIATGALLLVPLATPLLPERTFIAYRTNVLGALHLVPRESEHHAQGALPQYFADMHGWRELADRVAYAERTLSADERAGAAVFGQNYGEAAAVDFFGDGSLPVISGHNSYFLWGPHGDHPVLIIIGGNAADHRRVYADVREIARVHSAYAMPYENDLPIYIARRPKIEFTQIWPQSKSYN